jgi:phenol 2-monooxygenase (NADPH)
VYPINITLLKSTYQVPDESGGIKHQGGGPFDIPGLSPFKIRSLTQARIETFFLDNLQKYSAIEVERGVIPESLEIDESKVEDADAYPLTVKLRHLTDPTARSSQPNGVTVANGLSQSNIVEDDTKEILRKSKQNSDATEIVRAKYVIGCDGAHSWTRDQIGCKLEGDSTDFIFGVVDIHATSDFRESSDTYSNVVN